MGQHVEMGVGWCVGVQMGVGWWVVGVTTTELPMPVPLYLMTIQIVNFRFIFLKSVQNTQSICIWFIFGSILEFYIFKRPIQLNVESH